MANPDKIWYSDIFNIDKSITWKIVKSNPDIPWNYDRLSSNPSITWKIVKENPDIPWSYHLLSQNPMNHKQPEKIEKIKQLIIHNIISTINYKIE